MPHDIDPEAPATLQRVGEVGAVPGLEALERRLGQDLVQRLFDELRRQLLGLERREIAEQADARWIAGDEMQVRAALLEDFGEQGVDLCRGCEGILQSVEFVGGTGGAGARLSSFDSMVVSVTYFWKARFSSA